MLSYERFIPDIAPDFETAMVDTVDHIRGHISSCIDPTDSESAHYTEVAIEYIRQDGGTMVRGSIDEAPVTEYPIDAAPILPSDTETVIEGEL